MCMDNFVVTDGWNGKLFCQFTFKNKETKRGEERENDENEGV